MKKLLFFSLLMLGMGGSLFAQNPAAVTGTILDPNSVPYYPAQVTACLTPNTLDPTVGGKHVNNNIGANYCVGSVPTAPDGSFALSLFANGNITPAATQWIFTVQTVGAAPPAGKGSQSFTTAGVTISGSSQSVTSSFTGLPALLNSGSSSGAFSGGLGATFQDATEIATPANPAAGNDRLSVNSTTHLLVCQTSGGGSCMPTGGSPSFASVTAGTNAAALHVGTGGALDATGSGTISATALNGTALSGLATGIVKNTTGTGAPSIAVAGDFPTLNQNTSGTAANLSGTPALPNGTTATTQSVSDNTTKIATDAFVLANAITNPMTTLGDTITGGASGVATRLAGPTATNGVPQTFTSTPSAGAATAQVWAPAGVPIRASTCTSNADTVAATDRASYVSWSDASPCTVTLPQAGTTGFASNFVFVGCDIGAGTATITPTTSTISYTNGSAYTSAAATLALTTGQCAWIYSDNTNYFAILRSGGAGGSPALNSVTALSASNTPLVNGNFTETMGWQLTGSGVEDGWLFNETAASTNSGAGSTLAHIKTSSGSTIIPLVVETASNFGTPFIFQVKMNAAGVFGIDGNGAVQLSAAANNGLVSCNSGAGQFCRLSTGNAVDWSFFTNGVFAMGIPSGTGAQGSYIQIPNNGATATVVNKLAILTGAPSTATLALTSSTTAVVGLVIGGAGTTGNANILSHHGDMGNCVFDATAITAGDYVVASTTTGGTCHDAGATRPATLQIIGRAMATASASATVQVKLILDGE